MTEEPETPTKANHWRRRSNSQSIPPEQAARQGEITRLAFLVLGREGAIEFLNTDHSAWPEGRLPLPPPARSAAPASRLS